MRRWLKVFLYLSICLGCLFILAKHQIPSCKINPNQRMCVD